MLEMNINSGKAIVIDDQNRTFIHSEAIARAIEDAHVNSDTEPAFTLVRDSGQKDEKEQRGGQA